MLACASLARAASVASTCDTDPMDARNARMPASDALAALPRPCMPVAVLLAALARRCNASLSTPRPRMATPAPSAAVLVLPSPCAALSACAPTSCSPLPALPLPSSDTPLLAPLAAFSTPFIDCSTRGPRLASSSKLLMPRAMPDVSIDKPTASISVVIGISETEKPAQGGSWK